MNQAEFPLLSLIILLPLVGAVATGLIRDKDLAKSVSLGMACLVFLLTILMLLVFFCL